MIIRASLLVVAVGAALTFGVGLYTAGACVMLVGTCGVGARLHLLVRNRVASAWSA